MKCFRFVLSVLLVLYSIPAIPTMAAKPQIPLPPGANAVQQTASHADACTPFSAEAVAIGTTTITLTPGSTGVIYINEIVISNGVGASAVTAATTSTITTTNLANSLQWVLYSGTTAGSLTQQFNENYGPGGMKSQTANTNVTFVLPAVKTNQGIHMHGCYTAP